MKLNLRRNLLTLAVLLLLAAQAQALFNDTSFTVTLPADYGEIFFNATSATQSNVSAGGQTSEIGVLSINITGNATQNFSISVDSSATNVSLKAGIDNNPANASTITVDATRIISNLSSGNPTFVWLWADFISAPVNQVRLLTVNSSEIT